MPASRSLLAALLLLLWSGRARAALRPLAPVLAGRIDQLVPTAAGMALLREGQAWFLDRDGRVLGRCADPEPPAAAPVRARPDGLDAEDILRDAGFDDDDDDSPDAEAVLDDEGIEAPRRHPRAARAGPAVPRQLAAARGSDTIWIATSDGLRRAGAGGGGCARAALGGQDVALVAAVGRNVVAIADATVWWSRDDGASFQVAAVLPFTADALALDDGGDASGDGDGGGGGAVAYVGGSEGVLEISPDAPARRALDRRAHALAACAGKALALTGGGAYTWLRGEPAAPGAGGPPARAVSCGGAAGRPWIAAGVGLWTSGDGAAWIEEPDGLGLSIAAAIHDGDRDRWWLATDQGLLVTAEGSAAASAPAGSLPREGVGQPRRTRSLLRSLLAEARPHLALVLGGRQAADTRDEWHVRLLVTVRFGRAHGTTGRRPPAGGELARRRAELAVEARRLADSARDDEGDARLRAVHDEMEALR